MTPAARRLLADAVATVRANPRDWLRAILVLQALTAVVLLPVLALLLRAATAAAGVPSLNDATLGQILTTPVSVAVLVVLASVASVWALIQQGVLVVLGRRMRAGVPAPLVECWVAVRETARRILGRQLPLFAVYAFVLVPLGNLELGSFLSRGIELPPFIAAEVQKTELGAIVWALGAAAVLYLNLRLALVPVLLVTEPVSVADAMRSSWRRTRRRTWRVATAFLAAWVTSTATLGGTVLLAVLVTRLADAMAPGASAVVAGVALTLAQVVTLLVSGLVAAVLVTYLVLVAEERAALAAPPAPVPTPRPAIRWHRSVLMAAVAVVTVAATALNVAALERVDEAGRTAVIAHRGLTTSAVENTIASLEAAAAAGATYVELDVQQAADGGLVVVHDTTLLRIAGVNRSVFELTTDELTALTISQRGFTDQIPTFDEFAARAAELDVPLLVELKTHGHEQGDYLGDVVAVLTEHGLARESLVQAFDATLFAEVDSRFPEVQAGWVVAFLRGRLDPAGADFVTMEQSSYSTAALQQAHDADARLFLWTVTNTTSMRQHMRDGVDGLITGSVVAAVAERERVAAETGFAGRLEDELRSVVAWW